MDRLRQQGKDETVTIMARSTTAFVEKDLVAEAIGKALRTAQAAQKAAYEDVRTSSGICTDYLDDAVNSLQNAARWITDLRKEEKADERRSIAQPKAKPELKIDECHVCGNEIEPDDLAVCGGCDNSTCPNCMGDDGICKECEGEDSA
jgi:hypothetical protein